MNREPRRRSWVIGVPSPRGRGVVGGTVGNCAHSEAADLGELIHSYRTRGATLPRQEGLCLQETRRRRRKQTARTPGPFFAQRICGESGTHLRQRRGEVIAVLVHEVVSVALVLLAQLLHDLLDVVLQEVRAP